MLEININYAYDGFLYAPLFLADELGFFQKRMLLKYRKGDEATVNTLSVQAEADRSLNWFAICDPFAKDITEVQRAIGPEDPVCIIAAFIHRLPVWLYYSGGNNFKVCKDESKLATQRADVDFVRCYRMYNTGFLVGERVRGKLELGKDKLLERDFGDEFGTPTDAVVPRTLIVTSDILRLIKNNDLDTNRVVFSYARSVPELNPFLFTAVLTRKSVIDGHLDAVLSVLSGLRQGAQSMNKPDNTQKLTKHYAGFESVHVEKAVGVLTEKDKEDVYSTDFDLDNAAEAYEKARKAWQSIKPETQFPDIEKCREPIPCLLLKHEWHSDKTLVELLAKKWASDSELAPIVRDILPSEPPKSKHHTLKRIGMAAGLLVATVFSAFLIAWAWEKRAEQGSHTGFLVACGFIFLLQCAFSLKLGFDFMERNESKRLDFLVTLGATCLATIFGTVLALALVK